MKKMKKRGHVGLSICLIELRTLRKTLVLRIGIKRKERRSEKRSLSSKIKSSGAGEGAGRGYSKVNIRRLGNWGKNRGNST